jgi:FkbM family methyltransferase
MRKFTKLLNRLDEAGLRPVIAAAATTARWASGRRGQNFFVDRSGNWVNRQVEATVVSPTIHSSPFAAYRAVVLDQWTFQYCPQPGDIVFDVGAGVGEEAIVFSKLVGTAGRVLSIEADPSTFACLTETIRRSSLTNVTPLSCAITARDGPVTIAQSDNHIANTIIADVQGREVPGRTLDSLTRELGLDRIDLLKMNIEGAERDAVKGMTQLAKSVGHMVISCHDFIADGGGSAAFRTFHEVSRSIEALGFDIETRPDHSHPWTRYYIYARNRAFA